MLTIYPLNDFSALVALKTVNTTTAKVVPLEEGTVTFFLSLDKTPVATAADPTLTGSAVYVSKGNWLISFDAITLDPTLLDSLFASALMYLLIVQDGGIRTWAPVTYSPTRAAIVE